MQCCMCGDAQNYGIPVTHSLLHHAQPIHQSAAAGVVCDYFGCSVRCLGRCNGMVRKDMLVSFSALSTAAAPDNAMSSRYSDQCDWLLRQATLLAVAL